MFRNLRKALDGAGVAALLFIVYNHHFHANGSSKLVVYCLSPAAEALFEIFYDRYRKRRPLALLLDCNLVCPLLWCIALSVQLELSTEVSARIRGILSKAVGQYSAH
jgi:hypothetical protein